MGWIEQQAYKKGLERGIKGKTSADGFFDSFFSSRKEQRAREQGWRDGTRIKANKEFQRKKR